MKLHRNQSGFSVFELVLVVVVLGALAAVSFRVLESRNAQNTDVASQAPKSASDVSTAPVVNKSADLNKAAATLDQNDPATSNQADSNQLNGQLNSLN